jgi:hypothetical protein
MRTNLSEKTPLVGYLWPFIMCTVFILTFDLVPNFDQTGPLFQVPYIDDFSNQRFKVQTKKIPYQIYFLSRCMKTCPSIVCTHNIWDIIHTLGEVRAKILCPNCTPMHNLLRRGRANKQTTFSKRRICRTARTCQFLVPGGCYWLQHVESE